MKVRIDGKPYDVPGEDDKLTLGEQALLKREYGFMPARDGVDLNDPDHIRAFLFMTLRKALPDAPHNMLTAQVDQVRTVDFVNDDGSPITAEQAKEAADPTPAPPSAEPSSEHKPDEGSS